MWQIAALVLLSASPGDSCCGPAGCKHATSTASTTKSASQPAWRSESKNFDVANYALGYDAGEIAQCCESWRSRLQLKWLGAESKETWSPPCVIVVHARRESYRAAIGRGGEQSFGSSWIDSSSNRVSGRRIDLLVDPQGGLSALGHELTHVVLADAFPGRQPPVWANEGAAVLADSTNKRQLHQRDLNHSLQRQAAFHCGELLQLSGYPSPNRIATFYGQSASITAFLAEAGGTETLVPFLRDVAVDGYDSALRKHYQIQGLADLQQRWVEYERLRVSAGQVAAFGLERISPTP